MQQNIEDSERDAIFERLKTNIDNNKCFDCDKKNPKWSSVYLGIYLCLDCAGKHREYGPQISFARSLNLDTWNRRYITFMEHGGNTKALEYFKKQGLKAPYDYKNPIIQKYKQELTKKVDTALAGNNPTKEEVTKPVAVTKAEEEKIKTRMDHLQPHALTIKSFSDKATHGEPARDDPFANNIIINKGETKTKGFTVEFSKNKSSFASNKGRIAAKKIDNIDLDSLSLNEDTSTAKTNKFDMADSAFGVSGKSNAVKEVYATSNEPYTTGNTNEDTLKKFQNAKAISSDSFRTDYKNADASKVKQFRNASAISSAQYFGEHEEEHEEDWNEAAENVRDFISQAGGKLKEKADVFVSKMKEEWEA